MDAALTPDYRRLFAFLLAISAAVGFVVRAVLDAAATHGNEREPR